MSPYQRFGEICCSHPQGRSVYSEEEVDTCLLSLLHMMFFTSPQVFPCNVVA
jgi:hypothetical protein